MPSFSIVISFYHSFLRLRVVVSDCFDVTIHFSISIYSNHNPFRFTPTLLLSSLSISWGLILIGIIVSSPYPFRHTPFFTGIPQRDRFSINSRCQLPSLDLHCGSVCFFSIAIYSISPLHFALLRVLIFSIITSLLCINCCTAYSLYDSDHLVLIMMIEETKVARLWSG